MSNDAVVYSSENQIGTIRLNRADNRNSMTPELLHAFVAAVAAARADTAVRCLIITGTGPCFSAGADFKSDLQTRAEGARMLQPHERSYEMYKPFLSVLQIEVPVIGALNGHTVGGGFGLSLTCDIRIGNCNAKYGVNFAKLGLHPGMGISYLLPRVVGAAKAAELMFVGDLFRGEEGQRIGYLSAAVGEDEVMVRALDMARAIASNAPIAVRMTKRSLYKGLGWQVEDAAFQEAFAQAITLETNDVKEGINAFLAKRAAVFQGD